MKLKEYPETIFYREYYGIDRQFYNEIQTTEKVNDPAPSLRKLPDHMLKVNFYTLKNQNLHTGKDIPYFYLRHETASYSRLNYYLSVFFYCKGKTTLFAAILLGVSGVLTAMALQYESRSAPAAYKLTLKGKILLGLLLYNFLLWLI